MLDEQAGELDRLADLGEVDTIILLETVTRRFDAKSRLLDLRLMELDSAIGINRLLGPDEQEAPAPISPAAPRSSAINSTLHSAAGDGTPVKEGTR